jgi:hypothetical protein
VNSLFVLFDVYIMASDLISTLYLTISLPAVRVFMYVSPFLARQLLGKKLYRGFKYTRNNRRLVKI